MKLEDHIDILKEYPFEVAYPSGGNLFFLVWWTQWDRGHALAASSEERIEYMLRHVYAREGPEVELRDYRHAEIVSPPLGLRRSYAHGRMVEDLDNFRWYVGGLLRQAQSKDRPVKKEWLRCEDYRDLWSDSEKERKKRAEEDKDHSQCRNCFCGWLPKGHTVESLYLLRRKESRRYPGDGSLSGGKPRLLEFRESVAPEADPRKPLYALAQHFGNHSDGLKVDTVEQDEDGKWSSFGPHFHCTPVTFFFHGEKLDIPKRFLDLSKTVRADHKREEAEKKKAQTKKHRDNAEEANELLRKLLETP